METLRDYFVALLLVIVCVYVNVVDWVEGLLGKRGI